MATPQFSNDRMEVILRVSISSKEADVSKDIHDDGCWEGIWRRDNSCGQLHCVNALHLQTSTLFIALLICCWCDMILAVHCISQKKSTKMCAMARNQVKYS